MDASPAPAPEPLDRAARCSSSPPSALLAGIEQFNQGQFFEQHETLEALWIEERDPIRYLYQGILQVGVAFHHWQRGNFIGANTLLERGLGHLQAFRPVCMQIDVERLVLEAAACHAELRRLGVRRMQRFDPSRFPRIHTQESERSTI